MSEVIWFLNSSFRALHYTFNCVSSVFKTQIFANPEGFSDFQKFNSTREKIYSKILKSIKYCLERLFCTDIKLKTSKLAKNLDGRNSLKRDHQDEKNVTGWRVCRAFGRSENPGG